MRTLLASLVVFAFTAATPALADEARPFTDASVIDLVTILPPPPAPDSAQSKTELADLVRMQIERTPEQIDHVRADDVETVWSFGRDLFGPGFTPEHLPKFAAFFDRVVATEGAVVDPAKKTFARPRPHMVSDLIKPVVKMSSSGAYPSGHTTVGTLMGIVLANMIPERRADIMNRAWDYGHSRLVAGIHYPSDIEMGRISGAVIAATIMRQDDFKAEFAPAKAELRAMAGY